MSEDLTEEELGTKTDTRKVEKLKEEWGEDFIKHLEAKCAYQTLSKEHMMNYIGRRDW